MARGKSNRSRAGGGAIDNRAGVCLQKLVLGVRLGALCLLQGSTGGGTMASRDRGGVGGGGRGGWGICVRMRRGVI